MLALAEKLNITVDYFKLTNKCSFAIKNSIVIDESQIETQREFNKVLAHEIGHIKTNAFYPLHSATNPLYAIRISHKLYKPI